jgi:hypothetical protein
MGIPNGSRGKRGKKPGVKDTPDLIFTAKIRPEHPVGSPVCKNLIKKYVLLDTDIGAHVHQPVTIFISGREHEGC